jgi:hypothetical protein
MTKPGDSSEKPPEDQPRPGGDEPIPLDQAPTQYAQIPPPDFLPPAYAPPPEPPAYAPPPEPPPSYPPPPPYQPPPAGYPPQPPYQPPPAGYPPQPPYQSGYPGAPFPGGYGAPQPRTNPMAIGSLVASILGVPLFFACFTGAIAAIAGIVLGIVALNQIKQSGEQGRSFAIAGIVVGGVVLAFNLLFLILGLASHSFSSYT